MPKNKRDLLKRQLAHAYHNLDLAGYHLTEVTKAFDEVHPEMTEPLDQVKAGLLIQMQVLASFAFQAWGNPAPDWEAWRNSPDPWHKTPKNPPPEEAE